MVISLVRILRYYDDGGSMGDLVHADERNEGGTIPSDCDNTVIGRDREELIGQKVGE